MAKYIFLGLPLISVDKALRALMTELSSRGNTIIYYNTIGFTAAKYDNFIFKAYPSYSSGYDTSRIGNSISFFAFAEMLLDTTISIYDFLRAEVSLEKPDIIAHSHLALWGKVIAFDHKIPAVSIYTTFSLSQGIMVPFFREQQGKSKVYNDAGIHFVMRLQKKYQGFYKKIGCILRPDIWDVYINKEKCNVFLIMKELAFHEYGTDDGSYVGYPHHITKGLAERKLIYVSMGTIFNEDVQLFKMVIKVLGRLKIPSIIAIGAKIDKREFGEVASHITVVEFADQELVLAQANIFITRGGMASVHEAIASFTPMIVIPEIPEQQLIAEKVEQLGLGLHLPAIRLTEIMLHNALECVLENKAYYDNNLKELVQKQPVTPPAILASDIIADYCLVCCEAILTPQKKE
jgi:MGT family glycosyltransferase